MSDCTRKYPTAPLRMPACFACYMLLSLREAPELSQRRESLFQLMTDRVSRATWTLIPPERGQESGMFVYRIRRVLE